MTITKARLETRLREAEKKLQRLDKRLAQKPEFGRGDGSASPSSREMAFVRKERVMAEIHGLQKALVRMHEGTYGRCEQCGTQIDPERLEVLPTTTLCITCAQTMETNTTSGPKTHL